MAKELKLSTNSMGYIENAINFNVLSASFKINLIAGMEDSLVIPTNQGITTIKDIHSPHKHRHHQSKDNRNVNQQVKTGKVVFALRNCFYTLFNPVINVGIGEACRSGFNPFQKRGQPFKLFSSFNGKN